MATSLAARATRVGAPGVLVAAWCLGACSLFGIGDLDVVARGDGGGSDDAPGGGDGLVDDDGAPGDGGGAETDAGAVAPELFVIGGGYGNWGLGTPPDASPSDPTVISAPIHADGTLGDWVQRPPLPEPVVHDNPAVLTFGRYATVIGELGRNAGAIFPTGTVIFADLAGSGQWQTTTAFNPYRGGWESYYGAATDGTWIVIAGGTTPATSVQQTRALSVGGVEPWTAAPSLPFAMSQVTLARYASWVYAFGLNNSDSGPPGLRVVYAPITASGVGTWIDPGVAGADRFYFTAAVLGNHIYVAGGNNSASVEYLTIDNAGAPGAFQPAPTLPAVRSNACTIAGPNAVYVIGGSYSQGDISRYDTVYYAVPAPNGAIGSWQTTTPLPTGRSGPACVVRGG